MSFHLLWRFDNGGLHSCSKSNLHTEKITAYPGRSKGGGGVNFMEYGIGGWAVLHCVGLCRSVGSWRFWLSRELGIGLSPLQSYYLLQISDRLCATSICQETGARPWRDSSINE